MKTTLFLSAALLSLSSFVVDASTGTIRFSGRIVDPGCSARVTATQQLQLDACPASATGLKVSTGTSLKGSALSLETGKSPALSSRVEGTDALTFSDRYQLQPHQSGSYLVTIGYP